MVLIFFSFTPPYPIILMISIVSSSIITHKKWLCYFNMISLAFICIYYLFLSLRYIDAWIGLILSLIIINNKLSLDLELKRISPSNCLLNNFEDKLFHLHFFNKMTKEQFKYLFSKGKMIKTKSMFSYATERESFNKIYYFASISHKDAVLITSNNIQLFSVKEKCWLGTVEFLTYQKENINSLNQQWMVNINCVNDECEVCYFEWNQKVIKNIFAYSIDHVLLNNIVMMWNNSNATLVQELNKIIFSEMKKIGNPSLSNYNNKEFIKSMKNNFANLRDKGKDDEDEIREPLLSSND